MQPSRRTGRVVCRACGTPGKVRWFVDRCVVFWKRDGVWWRDEAPEAGPLCGYCGVPASVLLFNGWAERKRERPVSRDDENDWRA